MAENTIEAEKADISPVMAEYEKWERLGKMEAIDQALHPEILNNIPWDEKETPKKIAEFTLRVARKETLWWMDDRRELYVLEKDMKYDKARQVRREIRKILRKENQ